ncbi:MAG TPA: proton-conducting transporter membrane subunit, partial [Anaerolineaceae bacterium]|nr:proton-conducting transporter membrane subunit [Anaerolineaceae bacterium]
LECVLVRSDGEAVVVNLERAEGRGLDLEDYAGLGRKYPWLAAAMLVFMLSFTGAPLTLGFWGKFYLFKVAVDGGFWPLALVGLITSVVSAYYYLRVVVVMYMHTGQPEAQGDRWVELLAIGLAVLLVALSFLPGPLLNLAALAGL